MGATGSICRRREGVLRQVDSVIYSPVSQMTTVVPHALDHLHTALLVHGVGDSQIIQVSDGFPAGLVHLGEILEGAVEAT